MIRAILEFARRVKHLYRIVPGSVLEVGSCNVNGTIRDVFEEDAATYLGIDSNPGPGVDLVLDAHELGDRFNPECYDTILCCECLEHDAKPWITVGHMHSLLKPGGYLLVTTPTFGFPLHRYPIDCFRYGEDAYRRFIFDGLEILRLEEVNDDAGNPVICCLGRKAKAEGVHEIASPRYRIPADPSLGVVIGTHGSPGYSALHLHLLRRHHPEVPVLIVDDCSDEYDGLLHWCRKYDADLFINTVRLGHSQGDVGVFAQGLLWAGRRGLDLLVKYSRRFLPVHPWAEEFKQLAVTTQHHTYSNPCASSGFGFQTQAMGMHVESHLAMLPEYLQGARKDPGLVEAYIHQRIALQIPLVPDSIPYESCHGGYAGWPLVGDRRVRSDAVYWHETHTKFEYHALAKCSGINVGLNQF